MLKLVLQICPYSEKKDDFIFEKLQSTRNKEMILNSDFGSAHYASFVKKIKSKKISRNSKLRKVQQALYLLLLT